MNKFRRGSQIVLSWQPDSNGHVPSNAVSAALCEHGHEGEELYICRVLYNGEMIPGKVVPKYDLAYIPYNNEEIECRDYEVLVDTGLPKTGPGFKWKSVENENARGRMKRRRENVPHKSLVGGVTSDSRPLYIARARVGGETVIGKVERKRAYFPHGGQVHEILNYEVLVVDA